MQELEKIINLVRSIPIIKAFWFRGYSPKFFYFENSAITLFKHQKTAKPPIITAAPVKNGAVFKVPLIIPVAGSTLIESSAKAEVPINKELKAKILLLAVFRKFFIEKPF